MLKHFSHSMLTYLLTFVLLLSLSCKEEEGGEEPTPIETTLTIDQNTFDFPAEGGSDQLSITSNATWTISYGADAWCKPTLQTAKGDATVTINAEENSINETRTMTLTLSADGAEDIVITVNQEAGDKEPVDPNEPNKPDYIEPDNTDMRDLTSIELSQLMGKGWNLGNSLEAINAEANPPSGNETIWGNPVVTKELIDAVKAAGFNTIRIPVSWSHMLEDQETFKIKYEWKLRVEEVVNYALDNEMYVVINVHWDGGWMDHPFYSEQDAINTKLAAFWKQIGVFFRDYDDHLLFAGSNEVRNEANYDPPTNEEAEVQNSFNQTFVSTVRATGGRNAYRHLIVQGFNTNIDHTVNKFTIPDDEIESRLMVEVHYYDPYNFSLDEKTSSGKPLWGEPYKDQSDYIDSWGQEDWVDQQFGKMKSNFVYKGYPVLLGEYGALWRDVSGISDPNYPSQAEHDEARNYYLNYVTKTALANGMVPVYWDNGSRGNNGFALFNRNSAEVSNQGALDAIISAGE
ncbi:cellulase family glycosylhydrolase [Reichenbachiella ulvae]|uniref:Cellulase family glycosylhydrolase n=1 Tax=Reichenbachiella ulvae TaxID=2980104 RepID=A0ABT3CNT0_9BACT|nr:cellulase family glycosylhydrolase [Reichenbachiella ulvae]MCV9385110.1 cellulase family glycosylhydrolase [Reichenbachiella ulvae]